MLIKALNDNIFIWNLDEMLSLVYRIKQLFILLKHIPRDCKTRETDHLQWSLHFFQSSILHEYFCFVMDDESVLYCILSLKWD